MSIGIAIAVPDGIALAADTQTTWNSTITKAKEKQTGNEFELEKPIQMPVGWSRMAKKLFSINIENNTYAIITAGMAHLNQKSMYAVYQSGAKNYNGNSIYDNILKHYIQFLKSELCSHLSCNKQELSTKPINICEFILSGYEENDVTKPTIESHLVFSGTLNINGQQNATGHYMKWSNRQQPTRYGGCWIGRTAFISHIVTHSNRKLPPISGQYGLMTLADAIDYTRFLISFTCDFQRFAIMVPDCGRPIVSSTLTPNIYEEKIIDNN